MGDKLPLEDGKLTVEAGRPERLLALEEELRSRGFRKVPNETPAASLKKKQYTKCEVTDLLFAEQTPSILVMWRE